ncbi:M28 family peptidase [Maribacter sp. CXY002]|uniref:M28 family peptidase n=1 Tax=Maribacter luteocoastalis TaxID=3407671 RepID=UPI003B67ECF3
MGKIASYKSYWYQLFSWSIGVVSLLSIISACSQETVSGQEDYFKIIRPEYTGELAFETTAFVEQYWRVAGNSGFNKTVDWIREHLEKAGYVLETEATSRDRLTFRIEKRPMKHPTWEPVSASLQIIGNQEMLLESETNRNMTYLNSVSTPEEGITAEVIDLDQNENTNLKGKIGFTENSAGLYYNKLVKEGALGIITYNNPLYLQPEKNQTSIQFRSLPPREETKLWGIALSYKAKEKLKSFLDKGKTEVRVNIQTKIYPSEELTVVASITGKTNPKERLVLSAHIQEPGANDNATGVGAQLEIATLAAKLLKNKSVELNRTLTFLWGDEIISTRRYIQEDAERSKGIKWGISLDMVGENTEKTGGTFLIEKMPDPSAIWTRGNDKHSEWGGDVLSLEDMKPHYLNDFIIKNFKKQGAFANWEVHTNPFEGGSDHTPFLDANIPGLLLWHFTDQFYHTDNDRLVNVSQETLKNVGTATLASALELVNADSKNAIILLKDLEEIATKRLKAEFKLSADALSNNGKYQEQVSILKAWGDYYEKSFESVADLVQKPNKELTSVITKAQGRLQELNRIQINALNN